MCNKDKVLSYLNYNTPLVLTFGNCPLNLQEGQFYQFD